MCTKASKEWKSLKSKGLPYHHPLHVHQLHIVISIPLLPFDQNLRNIINDYHFINKKYLTDFYTNFNVVGAAHTTW